MEVYIVHRIEKVSHNKADSCGISCIKDVIFRVVRKTRLSVVSVTKQWSSAGEIYVSQSVPPTCMMLLFKRITTYS